MPVIFISYRRSDSQDVTGRIYDRLVGKFTPRQVFKDVDNIPLGVSFPMHIKQMLGKANVVLVIIGPTWVNATDENGRRRLDDPNDFVRVEVEVALRGEIPVIPVLVSNARMPLASELPPSLQKLVSRNGMAIRPDPDFNNDITRLFSGIDHLDRLLKGKNPEPIVVTPVEEEIVVEVVAGPPPVTKPKDSGSKIKGRSSGERPRRDPDVVAKKETIPGRLARCSVGGMFAGAVVAVGLFLILNLLATGQSRLRFLDFALLAALTAALAAPVGLVAGFPVGLLPRTVRHPFVLPLVWGLLIGVVGLGYFFYVDNWREFHDYYWLCVATAACFGLAMAIGAPTLEGGLSGYLTLFGAISLVMLLVLLGYAGYGFFWKPAANMANTKVSPDPAPLPVPRIPLDPLPPGPNPEPMPKTYLVRVHSGLGKDQIRETTFITIDGVTRSIFLSENGVRQSSVDFHLKSSGTFSYSLTCDTDYLLRRRMGKGSGTITVNGDEDFDLFMNDAKDDPFTIYLQNRRSEPKKPG